VHLHRACHIVGIPNPDPRAMVSSKREANEPQSLAAAHYTHNPFQGGMRLNEFTLGGKTRDHDHHWLVAKASIKHIEHWGRPRTLSLGRFESFICTEVKNRIGTS
jgi:hypothetical protein